jgi:hypothetical protein
MIGEPTAAERFSGNFHMFTYDIAAYRIDLNRPEAQRWEEVIAQKTGVSPVFRAA